VRSYFHNAICVILLTCSKCQADGNPMGSKDVAVWTLLKVVFGGYLFIPCFIELHKKLNYPAII
jgi:hypothetical protein